MRKTNKPIISDVTVVADKEVKDVLHNTLFVNSTTGEAEPDEIPELQVAELAPLDPVEDLKLEAKIGDSLTMRQRLQRRPNRITLVVIFLAIATITLAAYLIQSTHGTLSISTQDEEGLENGTDLGLGDFSLATTDFIPSFKVIKDVIFFEGYYWAATSGGLIKYSDVGAKFYGGKQGIIGENIWSLADAGGTLWVSYQGGVARYDSAEDIFVSYFTDLELYEKILNPNLFYDATAELLFLATYDGLYTYSQTADAWYKSKDKNAPTNGSYFVASKEGVFVISNPYSADGTGVVKYNRLTKLWSDITPSQISDPAMQLINIDGEVVAVGGGPSGKTQTEFLLRTNGGWQNIEAFANLSSGAQYIPGPQYLASARVRVQSSSGSYKIYELNYTSGSFSYKKLDQSYISGPIDDELFSKERRNIALASGLKPYYEVYGFDAEGKLYAGYGEDSLLSGVEGVLRIETSFSSAEEILNLPENSKFVPIFCGEESVRELKFGFAGQYTSEYSDRWETASFYTYDAEGLTKIKSLKNAYLSGIDGDVNFICSGDLIYWIADNYLWQFSPKDESVSKLKKIGDGKLKSINDSVVTFVIWNADQTGTDIIRYNAGSQEQATLELDRPVGDGTTTLQRISLAGGLLWIPSLRSETLHAYDLDGSSLQSFTHDGRNGLDVLPAGGSDVLVVQYLGAGELYGATYSFISTNSFATKEISISAVPGRVDIAPTERPTTAYDPINNKVWVSGIGSSIFAIEKD